MKKKINSIFDVITLVKPRITLLTLITACAGLHLAPGNANWALWLHTLIGTAFLVGGANALNMFIERDTDLLMTRTQDRPLPGKRLSPEFVLGFGSLLIGLAVPWLSYFVNPLTGALGALSVVSYVLFYTPLKRKTSLALWVGAVPGAMPPLLGWAAVARSVDLPALILFLIIFFWQVPHFLAIGIFRREEYAKAGIKILTLEKTSRHIKFQSAFYAGLLLPTSVSLYFLKVAGSLYLVTALVLGLVFFIYACLGFRSQNELRWSKRLFLISLVYLTVLYGVLFVDGGGL